MAKTLPLGAIQELTVSKIDILLKKIDAKLTATGDEKIKTETARLTLTADKKRLVDAKQKIVNWVSKEKQKADKNKSSKWVTSWRTTVKYGDVVKAKGQIRDAATAGMDWLDDKKQAIAAVGATAAIAGAAINYLPKLMNLETGIMVDGVAQTVGQVITTFLKSNPALTAGLSVAGIAALAVAIPTIRNKIRNSESYKGKIEARAEAAKLDADILALDEKEPEQVVNYYVNSALKFDKSQNLVIDQELIDMVAGDKSIMDALDSDLTTNGASMSQEQQLKLRALLNRAKTQRAKVEAAAQKEQNEALVANQINADLANLSATDPDKINEAQQKLAEADKKRQDAKALPDGDPNKTTLENDAKSLEDAAKAALGIDMSKYQKSGIDMISELEVAKRIVAAAKEQASMGS